MKKIIAVLLIAAMALSLCACGGVPKDMDRKTYKYGKEALAVMDDYLAKKIDGTEACEKLDEIRQNLLDHGEYLTEKSEKESEKYIEHKKGGSLENVEDALKKRSTNDTMEFDIRLFTYGINGMVKDNGEKYNCESQRNWLALMLICEE